MARQFITDTTEQWDDGTKTLMYTHTDYPQIYPGSISLRDDSGFSEWFFYDPVEYSEITDDPNFQLRWNVYDFDTVLSDIFGYGHVDITPFGSPYVAHEVVELSRAWKPGIGRGIDRQIKFASSITSSADATMSVWYEDTEQMSVIQSSDGTDTVWTIENNVTGDSSTITMSGWPLEHMSMVTITPDNGLADATAVFLEIENGKTSATPKYTMSSIGAMDFDIASISWKGHKLLDAIDLGPHRPNSLNESWETWDVGTHSVGDSPINGWDILSDVIISEGSPPDGTKYLNVNTTGLRREWLPFPKTEDLHMSFYFYPSNISPWIGTSSVKLLRRTGASTYVTEMNIEMRNDAGVQTLYIEDNAGHSYTDATWSGFAWTKLTVEADDKFWNNTKIYYDDVLQSTEPIDMCAFSQDGNQITHMQIQGLSSYRGLFDDLYLGPEPSPDPGTWQSPSFIIPPNREITSFTPEFIPQKFDPSTELDQYITYLDIHNAYTDVRICRASLPDDYFNTASTVTDTQFDNPLSDCSGLGVYYKITTTRIDYD